MSGERFAHLEIRVHRDGRTACFCSLDGILPLCSSFFARVHQSKPRGRQHSPSSKDASAVPGRTQTAVVQSSGAANPCVPVLKLWVVSLSPTLAGRDLTSCKL